MNNLSHLNTLRIPAQHGPGSREVHGSLRRASPLWRSLKLIAESAPHE